MIILVTKGDDTPTCKSRRGTIEWFKHEQRHGRRAPQNVLEVRPGLSERSKNCASASSAFKLFIAEEMVAMIVHETNQRAQSVYHQWNNENEDNQKIGRMSMLWKYMVFLACSCSVGSTEHVRSWWLNYDRMSLDLRVLGSLRI